MQLLSDCGEALFICIRLTSRLSYLMVSVNAVRRIALWTTLALVALMCLSYLTDLAVLRWRFNTKRDPVQTVTIKPYFAVPRKDGRTEFMADDPKEESCVNSLFPHAGASPCWYLQRHKDRRIDM